MSRPLNNIEKVILNNIPIKSSLLIAVSGGKDSVALLHSCMQIKNKYNLRIAVAHVNHGLRKKSSQDAKFVKKLAEHYELEYFEARPSRPERKQNIESWGRKERYKFFSEIAKEKNIDWILTAHTANDVAETFLIRLLSNKELNSIEYKDNIRKLLRPFLLISTKQILQYIKKHKLKFVEDSTNKENKFLRNKIRNKLLPYLAKNYDKRITETLSQRARDLQEDSKAFFSIYERSLIVISTYEFGSKEWLKNLRFELEKLPDFLTWRLIESIFKARFAYNLGRPKSKEVLKFIKGDTNGVQLSGGINIRFKAGAISISK